MRENLYKVILGVSLKLKLIG